MDGGTDFEGCYITAIQNVVSFSGIALKRYHETLLEAICSPRLQIAGYKILICLAAHYHACFAVLYEYDAGAYEPVIVGGH